MWSMDRNGWVGADILEISEKVKTHGGEVVLVSKEKLKGRHTVYNLEGYKNHNFLVLTDELFLDFKRNTL